MDCCWHSGVDFSDALKASMDSSLCDATLGHNVQRYLEEPQQHILVLEQEPHGPEEPNISESEPVSDQIRSVAQLCPTLYDPMNGSTPGLPVHHQLSEFTENHIYQVSDAIQPSHTLASPSPSAPNPSQHQSLFQ